MIGPSHSVSSSPIIGWWKNAHLVNGIRPVITTVPVVVFFAGIRPVKFTISVVYCHMCAVTPLAAVSITEPEMSPLTALN